MTFNFLDLPYENLFDEKYFPEKVLDKSWLTKDTVNYLAKANYPGEFKEDIYPKEDFSIVFLFKEIDQVPEIFFKHTKVIEVCPPEDIDERLF